MRIILSFSKIKKKQISYHKQQPEIADDQVIKEVVFDPLNSTITPDSNNNIIINVNQSIITQNNELHDEKRRLQYKLAILNKNKIFLHVIAADSGDLSPEQFYDRIEQSFNFKIDETYSELGTLFSQ